MSDLDKTNLDDFDFDTDTEDIVNDDLEIIDLENEQQRIDNQTTKDTSDTEENTEEKYVLNIVTDRLTSNLVKYFRKAGLSVSNVFNNLNDIKDAVLFQSEAWRLVIIDTGLGKFSSVKGREELMDILGLCDEDNKIAVFYTDKAIKSEAKDSITIDWKDIDWFNYVSTADTVARLLMLKEKYILANNAENVNEDEDLESLNIKGIPYIGKSNSKLKISKQTIDIESIDEQLKSDSFEQLPSFNVKY